MWYLRDSAEDLAPYTGFGLKLWWQFVGFRLTAISMFLPFGRDVIRINSAKVSFEGWA